MHKVVSGKKIVQFIRLLQEVFNELINGFFIFFNFASINLNFKRFPSAGHVEVAKILIHSGADVNNKNYFQQNPLFAAAYNDRADLAKLLIEKGADMNTKDKCGDTPLIISIDNSKYVEKYFGLC